MKQRDYGVGNIHIENLDMEDIDIGDTDRTEIYIYPSRRRSTDAPAKRRRRRRRGIVLPVFLCLMTLGSLTGCLFLVVKNRLLETKISEAAAYIEETGDAILYTEEEAADMVSAAVSDASRQKEEEILGRVKTMMENGEGTSAMLRELYPDEIVVAADSRYYFFPILDTVRHHSYIEEQFVMNEDNILEYVEDGQVISKKGIDVSKYQGEIDWEKAAGDGVEYAFIRLGIRGSTEGKLVLDDTYEDNMKGALENGIDVGVYFFTQALNREEAVEEAEFVLENLEDYDVSYPIVLDVEEITTKNPRTKNMGKQDWTDVCIAFCDRIEEAGYVPMIYGNLKTFMLMVDLEQLEKYEKWFAYYQTPLYFPYEFSIWQYSSTGKVSGIGTDVDMNVSMKDWGE